MRKKMPIRAAMPVFAVALTLGMAAGAPAANAGFFEQLFGMQSPPSDPVPAPGYGYEQAMPGVPAYRAPARKRAAAIEKKASAKQKVTDLMHDDTLHAGDAVMMKEGIHIYEGREAPRHNASQFVALDDAESVSRTKKSALLAMDTTRNDPLRGGVTPDTMASGRSASVSVPVTPGVKVTDARGKSIRYVGP